MNPDRRRGGRRFGLLVLVVTTLIVGWLFAASPGRGSAGSTRSSALATVDGPAHAAGKSALKPNQADATIRPQERTLAVPDAFLGLSTEYSTLPLVEKHTALYERLLDNLFVRLEHRDPLVLRIGGDSAEHVRFDKKKIHFPPWAFHFNQKVADDTIRVMNGLRLRVIIDINTISSNPREVSAWMKDFTTSPKLEIGTVVAFELGNEPDIYDKKAWEGGLLHATDQSALQPRGVKPHLPDKITPTSFAKNFRTYALALHRAAPKVPLVAPALAKPTDNVGWIKTLLRHPHPGLRVVSAHIYPYTACGPHNGSKYATIQRVLSESATAGMARTARPAIAVAHKAGLPLRLTEINSVTCGGVQGVSNTFATALWAPDALFELMRAGVEGVHLHARVKSINRPFSFNAQGLQTRPLLYGLILFTKMLKGAINARLVPVHLRTGRSLHLKLWAVRSNQSEVGPRSVLRVLAINKGRSSAVVHLHLPTSSPAYVQRLLARSASSTGGVTLGGQQLDRHAYWRGKLKLQVVRPSRNGSYVLRVRGESAAMVTVAVPPNTLSLPPVKAAGPAPLLGYQ